MKGLGLVSFLPLDYQDGRDPEIPDIKLQRKWKAIVSRLFVRRQNVYPKQEL